MPKYLIGAEEEKETKKWIKLNKGYFTWEADGALKEIIKKDIDWNKVLTNWEYSDNKDYIGNWEHSVNKEFINLFSNVSD